MRSPCNKFYRSIFNWAVQILDGKGGVFNMLEGNKGTENGGI